jgi:hypothetical protein
MFPELQAPGITAFIGCRNADHVTIGLILLIDFPTLEAGSETKPSDIWSTLEKCTDAHISGLTDVLDVQLTASQFKLQTSLLPG